MQWLLFALLISTPAMAQGPQVWAVQNPLERYDETTDLGKAMNICAKHRTISNAAKLQYPPTAAKGGVLIQYDDGWEDCNNIHGQWEASDEANKKAFIKKLAK